MFIPFIFMFRMALILFTLSKHVINCMFTTAMYITSQRNEIMYSILAMEEYLLRRALLATIYIRWIFIIHPLFKTDFSLTYHETFVLPYLTRKTLICVPHPTCSGNIQILASNNLTNMKCELNPSPNCWFFVPSVNWDMWLHVSAFVYLTFL